VNATVTTVPPGQALRDLLARPAILEQPAVCDPLTARLARDAGYEAVTLTGPAIGAHLPAGSAADLDDVERAASAVVTACAVPLLLDADALWGDAAALAAAVTRLDAAGVAAIGVSSQYLPDHAPVSLRAERRCAHADLLQRVRTACAARKHALVMARCDVIGELGYGDARERAAALLAAGADGILVHTAYEDDLRRLPQDLPGATLICTGSPTAGCEQTFFAPDVLERWGFSAISNKYHRCYCSRLKPVTRRASAPKGLQAARRRKADSALYTIVDRPQREGTT